ncbi:MAG: restriction endonuclease subunit S [Verrucomicrobia bacterium]|jgi:type I restriction enzyme S subunit|nr:restriction endonuclease subunit S [Verrucomicrobiota bacterium]MBP8864250.1 restriction endonuclease subunit S [Anaerolineae bacterium]OQC24756.1 MAG: EcoKI restriction-modification system protein HsdS [Verrucomicrobia bacterium ADurb.Bin063]HNW08015.1 restriction endonuclease subunit S [Verrucomicrobiota bacterium]HOA62988.1 restriction endonuclease subunit S [Verrucomicrobiota bacterium]
MKKGWQIKRLGEVCEIVKGRKPMLKLTPASGDLPYLVAKVMRGSAEAKYASVKDKNSITVEESETIIICDGSNSGEVFTGFRGILSSTMGKIAKKVEIDDNYLRAFLASTFEVFNGTKTGAAIPHLDKEAMYQLQFPLPPLPEQRRIVALLDQTFAAIATAKANAEKNLQNARALFESHLQSVFTRRGSGWVEKTVDTLSTNLDSKRIPITKSNRKAGSYPYYGASGIVDYVADYIFEGDALLVSEDGANLLMRSTPIAFSVSGKYWVNNHAHILKFENMATQRFVEFYLESLKLDEYIRGAAQPKLTQKALNSIPIPIPTTFEEQARIVENLDSLYKETQRFSSIYERKLAALDELKKSLLHQAFTGEL